MLFIGITLQTSVPVRLAQANLAAFILILSALLIDFSSRNYVILSSGYWVQVNPTSYGISDLVAATGGVRYHGRSHFGFYIAIDHLLPGTYRGHMPKSRLKSQKLNEILRFENLEIFFFCCHPKIGSNSVNF